MFINFLLFNHCKSYICWLKSSSCLIDLSKSKISNSLDLKSTDDHFLEISWHINIASMFLSLFFDNNKACLCWCNCLGVVATLYLTYCFVVENMSHFWFWVKTEIKSLMWNDFVLHDCCLEMTNLEQSIAKIEST